MIFCKRDPESVCIHCSHIRTTYLYAYIHILQYILYTYIHEPRRFRWVGSVHCVMQDDSCRLLSRGWVYIYIYIVYMSYIYTYNEACERTRRSSSPVPRCILVVCCALVHVRVGTCTLHVHVYIDTYNTKIYALHQERHTTSRYIQYKHICINRELVLD